jgi:hypothetical protein
LQMLSKREVKSPFFSIHFLKIQVSGISASIDSSNFYKTVLKKSHPNDDATSSLPRCCCLSFFTILVCRCHSAVLYLCRFDYIIILSFLTFFRTIQHRFTMTPTTPRSLFALTVSDVKVSTKK